VPADKHEDRKQLYRNNPISVEAWTGP